MPSILAGPPGGKRRFILVGIVITFILLFSSQRNGLSPFRSGSTITDPDLLSDHGLGTGSRASQGEKTPGAVTDVKEDDYRAHDHDGGEHAQEAPNSPEPSSLRWADAQGENIRAGEAAATTKTTAPTSYSPAISSIPSVSSTPDCVGFEQYQHKRPGPPSEGKRAFPFVRPPPECRTFRLPEMEDLITKMREVIQDPDLFRLFENAYPNTLDTMIKWRGYSKPDPDESTTATNSGNSTSEREEPMELTYVITGDIDAMWLRDSASQIYSYLPLLSASSDFDSLASLWRGVINAHSRYIIISPYCHSFQPLFESSIKPTQNGAYSRNNPRPSYDPKKVFDCKWELDSLASFLQISTAYAQRTGDIAFFGKHKWVSAVEAAVNAAGAMRLGTYADNGKVEESAWTFTGWTNRGSETLTNDGLGNPVKENGMVRTAFRPSDDACIFQLLTPANMMWAKYLEEASHIMSSLADSGADQRAANLTQAMRDMARGIRRGIAKDAVVQHKEFGPIFAYEVDGFGGLNLMDDANLPSLLAMPLWNYTSSSITANDPSNDEGQEAHDYAKVYQNTRNFVLSMANPYFAHGPVISAVGGPHIGPGKAWPMAAIIAGLTAFEDISGIKNVTKAVEYQLGMVLNSTGGTGVIHESVSSFNELQWTRAWFGWANGLFGELIMKINEHEEQKKALLRKSWQD